MNNQTVDNALGGHEENMTTNLPERIKRVFELDAEYAQAGKDWPIDEGADKQAALKYLNAKKALRDASSDMPSIIRELLALVKVQREALEQIAKRPALPNPDRDADWKNCMKWSAHDAAEALNATASLTEIEHG